MSLAVGALVVGVAALTIYGGVKAYQAIKNAMQHHDDQLKQVLGDDFNQAGQPPQSPPQAPKQ